MSPGAGRRAHRSAEQSRTPAPRTAAPRRSGMVARSASVRAVSVSGRRPRWARHAAPTSRDRSHQRSSRPRARRAPSAWRSERTTRIDGSASSRDCTPRAIASRRMAESRRCEGRHWFSCSRCCRSWACSFRMSQPPSRAVDARWPPSPRRAPTTSKHAPTTPRRADAFFAIDARSPMRTRRRHCSRHLRRQARGHPPARRTAAGRLELAPGWAARPRHLRGRRRPSHLRGRRRSRRKRSVLLGCRRRRTTRRRDE